MTERTLVELLDAVDGDDSAVAVFAGDVELTRAELRTDAADLAAELTAAGVAPGQAVAVMLLSRAEAMSALFGCWLAGAVFVPLNPRLTDAEVAHVLDTVGPAAVVAEAGVAVDRFGARPAVAVDAGLTVGDDERWRVVAPGVDRPVPPVPPDVTAYDLDVALISFTSGTTGAPKPVQQRHSGVLAMFEPVLAKLLGDKAGAVGERKAPMPNLIPVSLSLWAGIYNVLFAFRVGAAVVLMERFDTGEFARLVEHFGIRSTVLPPAAMVMLSDDDSLTSLAPLRFVRSISAPLSPLQARRFRDRFGVMVLNCYGQTEMGGEIVGWNAADAREFGDTHLGAAGRAHAGVSMRVVGPDGVDVPAGDEGELWVKTPALEGAADRDDLAGRLTDDGWLRSGDIVRLDAEGFLWIEGRVSDLINRGGMKVHPGEVEEVLRLSPVVADVAVVAAPDERLGEVPWAFVVPAVDPRTGQARMPDPMVLDALCREHLAPYKVPTRFVEVDELPRNDAGKVLRSELLAAVTG